MTANTARHYLYQVLMENHRSKFSHFINLFLMVLILANVVTIMASSEASIKAEYGTFFRNFEIFSIIIFTIEYVIRVWVSVEASEKHLKQPLRSRIRYLFTPMAIIDFLAILPFYFLFFGSDFLMLRTLRLIRVLKLTRYSRSMELLITVSKQEAETILSAIFILIVLIIISATGIYLIEGHIQPEHFGSIPRALWWATVTLTTVGYGDVVPITVYGKALGIVIVIMGIGMAALPAGILASGFTSEISRRREHFKFAILNWLRDGTFSEHEGGDFAKLRDELGITRGDAALMLREARIEQRRSKHQYQCENCGYVKNGR